LSFFELAAEESQARPDVALSGIAGFWALFIKKGSSLDRCWFKAHREAATTPLSRFAMVVMSRYATKA